MNILPLLVMLNYPASTRAPIQPSSHRRNQPKPRVVIGAVYNGQGQANGQGNQVGAGGTTARAQPLDTREAEQQLQAHAELLQALHANAQTHKAQLPGEAAPEQLPARKALGATLSSLQATEGGQAPAPDAPDADEGDTGSASGGSVPIGGGQGRIDTSERPDLVLSASGDIASTTPANTLVATGANVSLTTGSDTNLLAQRHQAWAVRNGISLFTRGEAKDTQRAVQGTGIQLHAASGNVRTEAQSGAFTLTAQKAIDLQSTAADIVITAPERIVLNGGGGYVKIEGGNIEIGTSGAAQFKAAAKELTGGGSASASHSLKKAGEIKGCPSALNNAAGRGASAI